MYSALIDISLLSGKIRQLDSHLIVQYNKENKLLMEEIRGTSALTSTNESIDDNVKIIYYIPSVKVHVFFYLIGRTRINRG
jgi:hypothetical protein